MSANKNSSGAMPAWHPNFRIAETLPDTKVIRTSFLVNAAAAAVLLGLGALLFRHEMDLHAISVETETLNAEMEKLGVDHRAAIPLQQKFAEAEKRFAEFENFRSGSWQATRLVERISMTLPRGVTVTLLDVQGGGIDLSGSIAGTPDEAAATFKSYLELLAGDKELADVATDIKQSTIRRDQQTNQLTFIIKMKLKKGK